MDQFDGLGDEHLLARIAGGDKEALEGLYNRYAAKVFSLARYMLKEEAIAEEVTQEVFLSLWLKASTFNAQQGTPKAWLMSIAHHRIIDHLRSFKRARQGTDRFAQDLVTSQLLSQTHTEDEAYRNMDRDRVVKALSVLPDQQRQVIMMAYFEGFSQSEIAKKLDQPLGTVKTRMRLALQKLRAALSEEEVH